MRYVKHCIGRAKPVMTALIAFPLGHAVGQAMLSGGALRYRMYTPAGFSATEVGATVLLANLPYALAFGLLLDISLVVAAETLEPMFRISSDWLRALGCIGLAKDAGYLLLVALRRKPVRLGGWHVNLPTPAMTALQLVVGIIDIVLVSSVLYLLLPASAGVAYLPFLAAYLASMLAGVLSHVPAGLGVLESMLLLLLPDVPPEQLLAAVLHVPRDLRNRTDADRAGVVGVVRRVREGRRDACACCAVSDAPTRGRQVRPSTSKRMSEAAAAFERGLDARRDAPVAARAGGHFLVHEARQAERLLDECVPPAMRRSTYDGAGSLRSMACGEQPQQLLRGIVRVEFEMLARPAGVACTTQLCGCRSRPGLLLSQHAHTIGPCVQRRASAAGVDRRVEREHARPARAHAHFGQVAKRAAVAGRAALPPAAPARRPRPRRK